MAKYIIDGKTFSTQGKLREYIREIRGSYADNQLLAPDDLQFMSDLLLRHESSEQKIGCGIHSMHIQTHKQYKQSRGFWLTRKDGTTTDFSFEMCLRNKPESKTLKFKSACRNAIRPGVLDFRQSYFAEEGSHKCAITSVTLTPDYCHIDHSPPWTFEAIIMAFIDEFSIDVNSVRLIGAGGSDSDGVIGLSLADDALKNLFITYHDSRAYYRAVSPYANLSIIKRMEK